MQVLIESSKADSLGQNVRVSLFLNRKLSPPQQHPLDIRSTLLIQDSSDALCRC